MNRIVIGVDDQPAAAQALHLQRLAVLTLPLLLERPLGEQEGQRRPHGEIDRRAQEEERDVQVGRLVLQDGVLRHRVGVRPEIQLVHAEGDRQEQQGHERQRPACRLQHPADHDAPRAAREVVHHRECQGPERDADPEDVGQQVRLEEVLAVGREADGAEGDACEADEHREPLQTGNTGRGGVGRLNHVGSCRRRRRCGPSCHPSVSIALGPHSAQAALFSGPRPAHHPNRQPPARSRDAAAR